MRVQALAGITALVTVGTLMAAGPATAAQPVELPNRDLNVGACIQAAPIGTLDVPTVQAAAKLCTVNFPPR